MSVRHVSRRAFKKNGRLSASADAILKREYKHLQKVFRAAKDVCPRDLALLLISEVTLVSALENAERLSRAQRAK